MLDHIVIHVDTTDEITRLKTELDAAAVPFEPTWGKAAKGFKIANIWVGQQYFEIVDIHSDKNLWQPQWAQRHARGDRGVYCIFFKVQEDVHKLYQKFVQQNIDVTEPERTRFKWLFGLLEKKLPWQFMLLPNVLGTAVELGIIRYDDGAEEKHKPFMVPNTADKGITGLSRATLHTTKYHEAQQYLEHIQHIMGQTLPLHLHEMTDTTASPAVEIGVELDESTVFSGFQIANAHVLHF